MSSSFNPYEAWLNLPADQQPPSFYQLLGVRNFESEPPVIAEAADDQLARVQSQLSGPNASEAQRLVAEIKQARETLLARPRKQEYDAQLQAYLQGQGPMPSAGSAQSAPAGTSRRQLPPQAPAAQVASPAPSAPAAAPAQPMKAQPAVPVAAVPVQPAQPAVVAAVPVSPPSGQPVQAVPMGGASVAPMAAVSVAPATSGVAVAPSSGFSTVASQTRLKNYRRRKNATAGMLLIGGAVFVLLAALGYAMIASQQDKQVATADPQPQLPQQKREYSDFNSNSGQSNANNNITGRESPPPRTETENDMARALGMDSSNFAAPGTGYRGSSLLLDADDPTMSAGSSDAGPGMTGSQEPVTVAADLAALDLGPAGDDEVKAVNDSLTAARKAIADRDYLKADESIEVATILAAHPETIDAVQRLRSLYEAVKTFWASVKDGVQALDAGTKFTVGSDEIEVLSTDMERLNVRRGGRTFNYVIEKLPPDIAEAVALRAFSEDDAYGKLAIGAFLVSDARADQARGRQLLDEAGKQGADVALLLAEVDSRPAQ